MSLAGQIEAALTQINRVLVNTSPDNLEQAQQLGHLADKSEQLRELYDHPPLTASIWSAVPLVLWSNVACPGSNCLELIDAPESVYKHQCISGLVGTVNPCSEYLDTIQALLASIAAQLIDLGEESAAEVVDSAAAGVQGQALTTVEVSQPTLGMVWADSPAWLKIGAIAAAGLLLIRVIK